MARLSLTGRLWTLPFERGEGSIVETLLARRGIDALGAGELLEDVGHNAKLFVDFERAAKRIERAIDTKETVAIFGDYDCDGVTGATLLVRFFRRRGINPLTRLPHRMNEGYGLRDAVIDEFKKKNVTLLVTVDTGVTAAGPITRAKELGIDVIVLDHHTMPEVMPPAYAIVHPGRVTDVMEGAPCGAGVAWSVIREMERRAGKEEWDDCDTDIALAAIGTVADIVELRGGNRTLTHAGLIALSKLKNSPLALICMHAGLNAPYTSRDIGFRIAPRINAAGRMADPHIALHALLGDMEAALSLDALNRERQDVVMAHMDALMPKAEQEKSAALCFAHADYSPGVCGLLAGRLCEAFGKPTLVAACAGGRCVASLRSIPGYDVTAALARMSDLLSSFGGHAMAAGCAFPEKNFEKLRSRFEEDIVARIAMETLTPTLSADCMVDMRELTMDFCDALAALEPFGAGNPEPRFVVENVTLENLRCVGRGEKHLQATAAGKKLIGFNLGHVMDSANGPLDLLCRIGIDTWRGARQPQLFLDDIRSAERAKGRKNKDQEIVKTA